MPQVLKIKDNRSFSADRVSAFTLHIQNYINDLILCTFFYSHILTHVCISSQVLTVRQAIQMTIIS